MFEWLKRRQPENATLKEPEWWRQSLFVGTSASGKDVNVNTAMRVSAVYASVRILAESIGSLPLHIYQRRSDGGKDRANNHPLTKLFSGIPNDDQTPQELIEYLMWSVLLRGTAYCEIFRNGRGEVSKIEPMDSAFVMPKRGQDNRLYYEYTYVSDLSGTGRGNQETRILRQDQVWRVPGLSTDGVTGYSPISQAREAIGVAIAAETHAAKTFANGTRIPAVFEMDTYLKNEDAVARLKADLAKYTGSDNSGKTMVLEGGLKYKQVGMTFDDAQFLESRKFQIAEIARMFRVPLHLLNELANATFSNIEHQSLEFVTHTLRPWCTRIEQTISRDLLTAKERGRYFAEFKIDALLRGDTKSRNESYAIAIQNGWLSRNEVRSLENRNPVEGLDEYLVPLNMAGASDEPDEDPEAELEATTRQEVASVRQAHAEMEPEQFDAWLPGFYADMAARLVRGGSDIATATEYTDWRQSQIRATADVDDLLDGWETK